MFDLFSFIFGFIYGFCCGGLVLMYVEYRMRKKLKPAEEWIKLDEAGKQFCRQYLDYKDTRELE